MTTISLGSEKQAQVLFSFEGAGMQLQKRKEKEEDVLSRNTQGRFKAGADDAKVPPVPIPNTEVKLGCAEDTWLETTRENR